MLIAARSRRRQRGLSIVEMMVGVAIGLFVVAAAALIVSTQLIENRKLLIETQLQQDMRASLDIVARELRRAGTRDSDSLGGVWYAGGPPPTANQFAGVQPTAPPGASTVSYQYYRDSNPTTSTSGFTLDGGILKSNIAGSGWQELTDIRVLRVTAFTVTPNNGPPVQMPCAKLCTDGTRACWPTLTTREFIVDITGEAANDTSVQRSLRSTVRLRNDWLRFNDSATPPRICPP